MDQWYHIPSFGGGLNLSGAMTIRDDEWSWSANWFPHHGVAEIAPAIVQIATASWLPASNVPIGLVPDLINRNNDVLLACRHTGTSVVRLFHCDSSGTTTEITVSGSTVVGGDDITTTYINGRQILAFGAATAGNYSLATYDGTNFARIQPTMALNAQFVTTASGRVIAARTYDGAALQPREVLISDAGSYSVWDADVSNSADAIPLWGSAPIIGLVGVPTGALVATSETIFGLTRTGGIPPFTVDEVEPRGVAGNSLDQLVAAPTGIFYDGGDDIYRLGGGGVGARVYPQIADGTVLRISKMLWRPRRPYFGGVIIAGINTLATNHEAYIYHPQGDAWWRRTGTPAASYHAVSPPTSGTNPALYWLMLSSGTVWLDTATGVSTGAFVDTKDFAFGTPPVTTYLDRIRVEWEPVTTAASDAVIVQYAGRNDFAKGVSSAGVAGIGYTTVLPTFTTLGTLTAGASELPIRQKAKIHRFRFLQSSGRVRLHRFSLRIISGADKAT